MYAFVHDNPLLAHVLSRPYPITGYDLAQQPVTIGVSYKLSSFLLIV